MDGILTTTRRVTIYDHINYSIISFSKVETLINFNMKTITSTLNYKRYDFLLQIQKLFLTYMN